MRALVFDLDGTLLHFTRDYEDVLADAVREVAGEAPQEWLDAYDRAFYAAFRSCASDPVRTGFAAIENGPDPEALTAALREAETEMCEPPTGARTDLERLAESFRLGVVTNGVPEWQRHKLRTYDLLDRFDAVVTSYEAGAHKPDTAPFELLEDRLPADAYAMVGDDDADTDGATAAGWTPHRYRGDGFGDLPDAIDWRD